MTTDSVALAAAWRARLAAGWHGPVRVEQRGLGSHVVYLNHARVGIYGARYKADAHAEHLARHYDPGKAATSPPDEPSGHLPADQPGKAP